MADDKDLVFEDEQPPDGFSLEAEQRADGGGIVQRAAVLSDDDLEDEPGFDGCADGDDDDFIEPDDDGSPLDEDL